MKKSRPRLHGPIVLLAVLAGCAPQVTITALGAERTYSPTPDSVAIPLYTITKPECPYDELVALTAEGGASEAALLPAIRTKARAIGGQAIIAYTQSHRASGGESADVSVRTGTAIRFRSADCMK